MEKESAEGGLEVFRYAVADKTWLYVAVMDAMVDAKERFRLQLRPAEVAGEPGVPAVGVGEIGDALEALAGWGALTRFYDTGAPETLDQFYAKRYLYQLTEAGLAAHHGIRAVRRAGLTTGRLSAVLLPGIAERLEAVRRESELVTLDGPRLYTLMVDLFGAFRELADNAARYMHDLAVETSSISGDDERFGDYKRAVFTYLNEFVGRLAEAVPGIAATVQQLDTDMARLIDAAAAADAAPTADGEQDDSVRTSFERRWIGVRGWFVRRGDEAPVAESLRLAMLDALNRILGALDRLHERHLRRVTREADFTQLARWFAASPREDAELLWDRCFGLYPARHLTELAGDEELDRGRSFWEVAPAEIAPRLRTTGTRGGPGRPGKGADYSQAKHAALTRVRAERLQAQRAVERLAGRTPARLSDLGQLDRQEFAQFLAVLDAALAAAPGPHGERDATSAAVRVVLRPLPGAPEATITTAIGSLRCDDHLLEITVAGIRRREVG